MALNSKNSKKRKNGKKNEKQEKQNTTELFKFPKNEINIKLNTNHLNLSNLTNLDNLDISFNDIISLTLKNNDLLARNINNMISDLSIDLVPFIIDECGYKTSGKEYRKELLNTIMEFKNSKTIKLIQRI